MSTPAIDKDSVTIGTYNATYRKSGQPDELVGPIQSGVSLQDYEHRPESITADRIRGFKKCAGWVHKGAHVITQSARVTKHFKGSPATYYDSVTYEGSIWNAGILPYPALASPNQVNRTLVKALGRLKDQQFHAGNFVATSRETIRTVTSAASHIARGVRRFRSSSSPKVWNAIVRLEGSLPRFRWCEIPSSWLELQYGWKPLMADVMGAITELYRESRYGIPYVQVKATTKSVTTQETTVDCAMPSISGKAIMSTEQRCDVFLVYGVSSPVLAELSTLGLINPAEIVWEVLPYSFVVDWFMPIGDWLSSLTGDIGYQFITGGQSRTSKYWQVSGTYLFSPQAGEVSVECSPPVIKGKAFNFERVCFGSTPVPGIYVKNPISLTHLANALALLAQSFR